MHKFQVGDVVGCNNKHGHHWYTVTGTITDSVITISNLTQREQVEVTIDKGCKYIDGSNILKAYEKRPLRLYVEDLRLITPANPPQKEDYEHISDYGVF